MLGVDHCFFEKEGGGGGGFETFLHAKIIFIGGSCSKQFFLVCLRLPVNIFFFTCIQFISVSTASGNNLFQNF